MRESLKDIKHMVKDVSYKEVLPENLQPYHVYLSDAGHSIMCILETHLTEAQNSNMDDYELPVPVRYVLEKGYRIVNDYVVVDAKYDKQLGLVVEGKYYEF